MRKVKENIAAEVSALKEQDGQNIWFIKAIKTKAVGN